MTIKLALRISNAIYYARLSDKSLTGDRLCVVMNPHDITNKEINGFDVKEFAKILKQHVLEKPIEKQVCFPRNCSQ